jgi:hypothetical protein
VPAVLPPRIANDQCPSLEPDGWAFQADDHPAARGFNAQRDPALGFDALGTRVGALNIRCYTALEKPQGSNIGTD